MKKHEVVHLKAELGKHFVVVAQRKRYKVHHLLKRNGAELTGSYEPEVACGERKWKRRVTEREASLVTCKWCRRSLRNPLVSPRSGMSMPRPSKSGSLS